MHICVVCIEFYSINDQYEDALLYATYYNGAYAPLSHSILRHTSILISTGWSRILSMLRILIPKRVVGYFLSLPLISTQSDTQSQSHKQTYTQAHTHTQPCTSTRSGKQGSIRPACSTAGVEDTYEGSNNGNITYKTQVYENGIELDP